MSVPKLFKSSRSRPFPFLPPRAHIWRGPRARLPHVDILLATALRLTVAKGRVKISLAVLSESADIGFPWAGGDGFLPVPKSQIAGSADRASTKLRRGRSERRSKVAAEGTAASILAACLGDRPPFSPTRPSRWGDPYCSYPQASTAQTITSPVRATSNEEPPKCRIHGTTTAPPPTSTPS